ncbi:MAG: copper resistance system multicopper oxidase [Nitrospirae bacterium]|nr:copper resistance system multicopper oxidase [Nitrospirota bacterium]
MLRIRFIGLAVLIVIFMVNPIQAKTYNLVIEKQAMNITGHEKMAFTINGSIPGPLLRWREGEEVAINVTNKLDQITSIHWHGILLPSNMDGVPGISFEGIRPGETFTYRFTVKQSGTYWYHSHSETQTQMGFYAPIIIDPAKKEALQSDQEYVVFLSDWTDEDPHQIMAKLKKQSDYYNFQRRTLLDLFHDVGAAKTSGEFWNVFKERLTWGRMRMDPTDISDVTGYTYTFLLNGKIPDQNWTALYKPGERIRLRFINGSAMTYFDVKIPGLKLEVVQADGQNLEPVRVDELRIAVAETYDVIVSPEEDHAYTLFAESIDRSGYARGTLAPRTGMIAPVPKLQSRPILAVADMPGMQKMQHVSMEGMDQKRPEGMEMGSMVPMNHGTMQMDESMNRMDDRGGYKILSYRDLHGILPGYDTRIPKRVETVRLTGNMRRYIWMINDKKFSDADPIKLSYGERVRITFINETMMHHPMHLHGIWMQIENGQGGFAPLKHVVDIPPGKQYSVDITGDTEGEWVLHCHLLYHQEAGMMTKVVVAKGKMEGPK